MPPVYVELPKMQQVLSHSEEWNAQWERLGNSGVLTPQFCLVDLVGSRDPSRYDMLAREYATLLTFTLNIQRKIDALAEYNLESKWLESTPSIRKSHVLVALSEACSAARNIHDARRFAGDILIDNLGNDGRVLIDLLKAIMPRTPQKALQLRHTFPTLPGIHSGPMEKWGLSYAQILRTELIYLVVLYTSLSFLGKERPKIPVTHPRGGGDASNDPQRLQFQKENRRQLYGPSLAKEVTREDKAAAKERQRQRCAYCTHCSRPEQDDEKFPHCGKCWNTLQRDVPYCSRECQTANYKPLHKAICGKALDLDTAVSFAMNGVIIHRAYLANVCDEEQMYDYLRISLENVPFAIGEEKGGNESEAQDPYKFDRDEAR
ncbi:uncharacterized protein ARMOST_04705 [Armillaria ostoyae]|uniref:MYND-type domain-containing protein n=1 Tax=Armillaria ostoyae TaxID=47428 RepID=A0A284QY41_ARMOS|nr:uncharacterized protein ARMOST_04705 [Armillaria ostoyae]